MYIIFNLNLICRLSHNFCINCIHALLKFFFYPTRKEYLSNMQIILDHAVISPRNTKITSSVADPDPTVEESSKSGWSNPIFLIWFTHFLYFLSFCTSSKFTQCRNRIYYGSNDDQLVNQKKFGTKKIRIQPDPDPQHW